MKIYSLGISALLCISVVAGVSQSQKRSPTARIAQLSREYRQEHKLIQGELDKLPKGLLNKDQLKVKKELLLRQRNNIGRLQEINRIQDEAIQQATENVAKFKTLPQDEQRKISKRLAAKRQRSQSRPSVERDSPGFRNYIESYTSKGYRREDTSHKATLVTKDKVADDTDRDGEEWDWVQVQKRSQQEPEDGWTLV